MSYSAREYSISEIENLLKKSDHAQNMVRKELTDNYNDFIEILYDDLDLILSKMEANPQFYYSDEEDKITHSIVTMLQMRNYGATQGTTAGGNVDITVQGPDPKWNWIAEAKIYNSLTSLREGFLQLTTRYRNASPVFSKRGLLAYTKRQDPSGHLKKWDEDVKKLRLENYGREECERRGNLAFYTLHQDKSTSQTVTIRHTAVCLYHLPEDKSGRSAKKYKNRINADGDD